MNVMRAENKIQMTNFFMKFCSQLLSQTTARTNNQFLIFFF